MKILQIGPVSYVGGVSIHIRRLVALLNDKFEFNFIDESPYSLTPKNTLNIRRIKDHPKIIKSILIQDLIHIHSGNWFLRLYFIFISIVFRKSFIVTLHSYRINRFKALITGLLLSKAKVIIAVNKEIKENLPHELHNKTIIKEAFLPPIIKAEAHLPQNIIQLVHNYTNQKTLVCANAFRIKKFENGELYGLDQCIEVAKKAKTEKLNIHIVFVIGLIKEEDKEYYNTFLKLIKENHLTDFITIIPKSLSFVRLMQLCDITLRPTLTDGDALTIREALFLNKKVIASDVVVRPFGTYTYSKGDSTKLFEKIKEVSFIKNSSMIKKVKLSNKDYKKEYINIYNQCNNSPKN